MKKTTKAAQMPPSITLRLSRGRSVKITWRPRQRVSSLLVKLLTKALAVFLPLSMGYAHALDVNALPTGGQVTAGSATINQTGNTLNINQASQKAALNWQSFNIGTNGTVNFVQPNNNAVALNRIGGNSASEIYGHLNANGQVFLMNPNGILFGRGSQVNVGGIVATTMQLGDADFLAGNYNFSNAGVGSVANYGLINATNSVALLGGDVTNQGSIFATTASLVSGNTVALDVSTDGLIRARVVDAAVQANITNSGDINATQVTLSAGQAKDTLNRVVNNSGVIKATGFSSLNGEITLQGGTTLNSGTLDATSATGNGGTVHMLGQHVGVVDSGSIDVSGATGGGTILVGGDYQGKNTSIENAQVTYVGAQTFLKADATQNGNGGKVIVWADDTARAYGSISAQGGALGGDGGFVETSGKQWLGFNAQVNTMAANGKLGTLLLDPDNISIVAIGPDLDGSGNGMDVTGSIAELAFAGFDSFITTGALSTLLASTAISLEASNDINVSDPVINSGISNPLILTAGNDINMDADITLGNGGLLTLIAGHDINVNTDITLGSGGDSTLTATHDINVNANITLGSGGDSTLTASHDITFDSTGGPILISTAGSTSPRTLILNASGDIAFTGGNDTSFQSSSDFTYPIGLDVRLNATRSIKTDLGSSVTLDGAAPSAGMVSVTVPIEKEWKNDGELNINGNAIVLIESGATFKNDSGALVNVDGTDTGAAAFYGFSGDIINEGTINVNTDAAFGTAYTQQNDEAASTKGTLNIADGKNLTLWNAISLEGEVSFAGTGTLNIDDNNGIANTLLKDLTISGGTLNVAFGFDSDYIPSVEFDNVTAPDTTLNIGAHTSYYNDSTDDPGNVTITGDSVFNTVNYIAGTFSIINSKLGITSTSDFIAPPSINTGDVGYYAAGNLIVNSDITTNDGTLNLMAGWDETYPFVIPPSVSVDSSYNLIFTNSPTVKASGDIHLDASGYIEDSDFNAHIITPQLIANATDGIDLDGYNHVDSFSAHNTGSGSIYFSNSDYFDAQEDLVPGDVSIGTITNDAVGGNVDIYSDGSINLGLINAVAGDVYVTADLNINDSNDPELNANHHINVIANYAEITAGNAENGPRNIHLDTNVSELRIYNDYATELSEVSIYNQNSLTPLILNVYSANTDTLSITNNNSIHIGHIGGAVDTTITATGATSDIEINYSLYEPQGGTLLSEGNVTLDAGRDILINDDYISAGGSVSATARTGNITLTNSSIDAWGSVTANANGTTPNNGNITLDADTSPTYISAGTGMSLTAIGDISLNATDSYAQLIANNGEQSITATAIDLRAGNAAFGAYAEIEHAGSGDQIVDVGTLTLTGGETGDNNYARIENSSADSIQKIGSNTGRPIIVMHGGDTGGAYNSSPIVTLLVSPGTNGSSDGSNSAEINSEGRQEIYANTITMNAGNGLYAGAIISAPNQQITTTSHVTLNGGSSNSPTSDDQFDYNGVTYDLASPAAIGDKDTLNQKLNIGGILTLTAGSGSSGLAMVGSLNGVATNNITTNSRGSITADSIVLDSGTGNSLALLGGVEDIVVTDTFTNFGGVITNNPVGTSATGALSTTFNSWSIWALNPTKITDCNVTGCLANFAQYNSSFIDHTAKVASGNSLMYSATPTLSSIMTGAVSKPYDGNTSISLTGATFSVSDESYGDNITLASISGGTGTLDNPNEGTGKLVTASGMQVTGVRSSSATGSIPVYGYSVASASAYIGTVSAAVVTDDVQDVITAINNGSETTSSEQDNQTKQEEDEIKAPEKVLVASNFVDDPKANNENPVETEKPKGRTLQCSVSK